jgi:AcrR family transcriptional regulator
VLRVTPERKEEKERVRLALLRAALRLGAAHGFASLGLREVSRAAEIAPTSFYRHFADMEELGLAVITELVGPLFGRLRPRPTVDAVVGSLDDMLHQLLDVAMIEVSGDPELVRFIVSEHSGAFGVLRVALRECFAGLAANLAAAVGGGVEQRDEPSELADAAVVLLVDALERALDRAPDARAALAERSLSILRTLLAARPHASAESA